MLSANGCREWILDFKHVSVLYDECISGLNIKPDGIYIDATMGGAGHSMGICKRLSEKGMFIGIDRDEDAFSVAKERLSDTVCKKEYINSNFSEISLSLKADGILADLGVSSFQLDSSGKGFSYRSNEKIDMRMQRASELTAEIVVNTYRHQDLYRIISQYGEEKYAKNIATSIIKAREQKPIETTDELSEIIRHSMPYKSTKEKHPSKRTFQAIRIEVNDELGSLKTALRKFFSILNPGGRLCIISFHSLEDRLVKEYFKSLTEVCTCPPDFPVCVCGNIKQGKLITRKPILPSKTETEENPRSKSAKLRIIEKI